MLKHILVAAALLAPALTYGADLSVQIVPAASPTPPSSPTPPPSSNGIACDIGPNYTGTIPAGAQAAGFTHCAANYDFSQPFYATQSNWLNCAGASKPPILHSKRRVGKRQLSFGMNLAAEFSIVSDGGSSVLQLAYRQADWNSGNRRHQNGDSEQCWLAESGRHGISKRCLYRGYATDHGGDAEQFMPLEPADLHNHWILDISCRQITGSL